MGERVLTGTRGPTSRDDADERLLVEAAQRDPARFAEIYERHFEQVYAFIARRMRDRPDTEDLTSEVFRRALANLSKFEWRGTPFAAWLLRIAANAVADRWKRGARERHLADAAVAPEPGAREARHDGERAQLLRLVDRLPAEQRRVILLRFAEEKSVRQIAGRIGRSDGAVRQLQFRALEKLRAQLDATPARKSEKKDG